MNIAHENLEALASMRYPGRGIVFMRDRDGEEQIVYFLSGRSESSKARRIVRKQYGLFVDHLNPASVDPERLKLIQYPALITTPYKTVVSNGAQTTYIADFDLETKGKLTSRGLLESTHAIPHMTEGVEVTLYEPDAPNNTARITGVDDGTHQLLYIVRKIDDVVEPDRKIMPVTLAPGEGKMVTTYEGSNRDTPRLQPFAGDVPLPLAFGNLTYPQDIAKAVYEAVGEFVVGVAVYKPRTGQFAIENLHNEAA